MRIRIAALFAFAVFATAILLPAALPVSAGSAPARGNGLIAFVSDRTGDRDIYTMNLGGFGQTDLSNVPGSDEVDPAWSPNGSRLAFTSNRDGNLEIYVMNADGSGQANLTNNPADDSEPTWSADGNRIAFVSNRTGDDEVFVMNADGSGQANLTKTPIADDADPAWSPDGSAIAFTTNRTGDDEVYLMKPDGTGQHGISSDPSFSDSEPAWSPDGALIAFTTDRTGDNEVFVMDAAGGHQTNVSKSAGNSDSEPVFMPNEGHRLVFTSNRTGNREITIVNITPTLTTFGPASNISHNNAADTSATWQPLLAVSPSGSPIQHIVVMFQENHSFDNVLGYLCVVDQRCDGATEGVLSNGQTIPLTRAPDIYLDISHDAPAQLTAINDGQMNGFDLVFGCKQSDGYACYSQYQPDQIPALAALARSFVISDRTFETDPVGSFGAHIDIAAATSNGFSIVGWGWDGPGGPSGEPARGSARQAGNAPAGNPSQGCDSRFQSPWAGTAFETQVKQPACIPKPDGTGPFKPSPVPWTGTIMDRLSSAGIDWKIYGPPARDGAYAWAVCPRFAGCLYTAQRNAFVSNDTFATNAQAGTLPAFSFLIPDLFDSQHNLRSMTQGDNWISSSVSAVMNGPNWDSTAIFILYDDCGCMYDHVTPPPHMGVRLPMVIVSPFAKPGYTDSNVASMVSVLTFAEKTFGLAPLTSADANAYDYSASFDFSQKPIRPMRLPTKPVPAWELQWIKDHPDVHDPDE